LAAQTADWSNLRTSYPVDGWELHCTGNCLAQDVCINSFSLLTPQLKFTVITTTIASFYCMIAFDYQMMFLLSLLGINSFVVVRSQKPDQAFDSSQPPLLTVEPSFILRPLSRFSEKILESKQGAAYKLC
jgi:hypothetical protein